MVSQSKSAANSNIRTVLDFLLISLGMVSGAVFVLAGLWLWFDYQANPAGSFLAQVSGTLAAALPAPVRPYLDYQTQVMGLPLTGQTSAYWYMARAGGLIAYVLMWASTAWGLLLSTKIVAKQVPPALAYSVHEYLAILTIIFAAIHTVVLLGDNYIDFNVFHLLVPFIAPYEPFWTGLGTIALYLTVALTASFYVRKFIGQRVWRVLHYLTFGAYILALLHGLQAGSDTSLTTTVLVYWSTGISLIFLVYYRLFTLKTNSKK